MTIIKKIVKELLPPFVLRLARLVRPESYGWFSGYEDWSAAASASGSYQQQSILERVRGSVSKVLAGQFAYERDSVVFSKVEYNYPLLFALVYLNRLYDNLLVVDFGGSLASTYIQHREILSAMPGLSWLVIEQEPFVVAGRELFGQDDKLSFMTEEEWQAQAKKTDYVVLMSASLQYLEQPYKQLNRLIMEPACVGLIFDRLPVIDGQQDLLTVQKVDPVIYEASYPCWFFSLRRLLVFLSEASFSMQCDWPSLDSAKIATSRFRGMLFTKTTKIDKDGL